MSCNSDGEHFASADDLRINLWNLEVNDHAFSVVDLKPANMEDLTEVITSAAFHPVDCNVLLYASLERVVQGPPFKAPPFNHSDPSSSGRRRSRRRFRGAYNCNIVSRRSFEKVQQVKDAAMFVSLDLNLLVLVSFRSPECRALWQM